MTFATLDWYRRNILGLVCAVRTHQPCPPQFDGASWCTRFGRDLA